jgi:hypothetical protein
MGVAMAIVKASMGLATAIILGSCSAIDPSGEGTAGGPGEIARLTENLTVCACDSSDVVSYSASGITPFVTGPDVSSHICYASKFKGPDQGTTPYLNVFQGSNGKWTLSGYGKMWCVPQCCFYSDGGGADVRWVSEDFETVTPVGGGSWTAMWNPDSMPLLTGGYNSGNNDGFDPGTGITVRTESPTKIAAYSAENDDVAAGRAYSFFVGIPNGFNVPQKRTFSQIGIGQTTMIRTSAGVCSFYGVWGIGPDAEPEIIRSGGDWVLRVVGTNDDAEAWAHCWYYDQGQD